MGTVMALVLAALFIYPTWRVCERAGFPGWLGVLIAIPVANLVLLYYLAFAEWPALRDGPRGRIEPPPEG